MIPVNSVKVVLSTTMKLIIVHLTKIYADINYSEMDQIMPTILLVSLNLRCNNSLLIMV